jgi:hypothetical protein
MVPLEVAIERLRNPKLGGKIWEAREYGVDLTLLIDRLRFPNAPRSTGNELKPKGLP